MIKFDGKKTGIFAAGVAFGTQTAQQPFYVQRHV